MERINLDFPQNIVFLPGTMGTMGTTALIQGEMRPQSEKRNGDNGDIFEICPHCPQMKKQLGTRFALYSCGCPRCPHCPRKKNQSLKKTGFLQGRPLHG